MGLTHTGWPRLPSHISRSHPLPPWALCHTILLHLHQTGPASPRLSTRISCSRRCALCCGWLLLSLHAPICSESASHTHTHTHTRTNAHARVVSHIWFSALQRHRTKDEIVYSHSSLQCVVMCCGVLQCMLQSAFLLVMNEPSRKFKQPQER